jgi:hypothetical protein
MSQGLTFPNGMSSSNASIAWTVTRRSWFSSHRSWAVNWFSKQSAIALAFSFWWYVIPKGQWTAVDAFDPSLFINDSAIGHRACGVTSQFPPFVSLRSSNFLRLICLIVLATILTVVLHGGSRVTCRSFLNLPTCFTRLSRPGRPLLRSEILMFLVHSLYAKALKGYCRGPLCRLLSTAYFGS